MNGVNLMPAYRRQAQRRVTRVRFLGVAVVIVTLGVLAAQGILWSAWGGDGAALAAEADKLDRAIAEGEKAAAVSKAGVREIVAKLGADEEVADQPDWGLLLSMVAQSLGSEAALDQCRLEASTTTPAPGKGGGKPGSSAATSRPARLTLTLTGVAKTQDAASQVALALKGLELFEEVSLLEARRTTFMAREAVAFQIECSIADRGPPGAASAGGEP